MPVVDVKRLVHYAIGALADLLQLLKALLRRCKGHYMGKDGQGGQCLHGRCFRASNLTSPSEDVHVCVLKPSDRWKIRSDPGIVLNVHLHKSN